MKKFIKNFLIIGLPFLCLALISAFLLPQNQDEISAQDEDFGMAISQKIICDEPIPIGDTIGNLLDLIADVYGEFQETRGYLASAIDHLNAETAELFEHPEEVCNFKLCKPDVVDDGFDIKLKLQFFGTTTIHVPQCKPQQCQNDPCPDLDKYIKEFTALRNSVSGSWQKIHDIFNNATIPIPDNLKEEGEGDILLTKPELIARQLRLARQWLYPTVGPKRSCALSVLEKTRAEQGEIGDVYPMRCIDALKQGIYWPRAWSEACDNKCKYGPTKSCTDCLKAQMLYSDNFSPLAQINYGIYRRCQTECEDELTPVCIDCLCEDKNERECTAWLCGGSYYNYVCCHEQSLERE